MKIGFFDSGIGGMTVLYQALKILPREDYVYFADTLHVPYGEKPKETVRRFVFEAADFIAAQGVKALVVACNAATSAAVRDLRAKFPFPVIGIEPAVKPAIQRSQQQGKRVLVLSTRLTLREEKYNALVSQLDDDHIVDGLPLPGLVEFAEKFEFRPEIVGPYLQGELSRFKLEEYGTVVLGCTHFPLFKDVLREILPGNIDMIDGGIGTANHLKSVLEATGKTGDGTGRIEYYSSGTAITDTETLARYNGLLVRMKSVE